MGRKRDKYRSWTGISFLIQNKVNRIFKQDFIRNIPFVYRKNTDVCPACLSSKIRKVDILDYLDVHLNKWGSNIENYFKIIDNSWYGLQFEVWGCDDCQLAFVPFTVEGLTEKVENHPVFIDQVAKPYLDLFQRKFISREYVDNLYNGHHNTSIEIHVKNAIDLVGIYATDNASFLDLGSCLGAFAECVRIKYPQLKVHGCEINNYYYRTASERYPAVTFSDKKLNRIENKAPFDIIYCSDVIEHIWDLDEFVASLKSNLKKNGHLLFITPDFDCLDSKILGTKWWGYIVPHHAQLFSISSLSRLLQRFGFHKVGEGKMEQEFWTAFTY